MIRPDDRYDYLVRCTDCGALVDEHEVLRVADAILCVECLDTD